MQAAVKNAVKAMCCVIVLTMLAGAPGCTNKKEEAAKAKLLRDYRSAVETHRQIQANVYQSGFDPNDPDLAANIQKAEAMVKELEQKSYKLYGCHPVELEPFVP